MPRLQLLLKKLFKNLSICCIVNTTAIQVMLKIHHLVYNKIASTPLMQCFPEGYQSSFLSSVGNTCLWLPYVCLFCASWYLIAFRFFAFYYANHWNDIEKTNDIGSKFIWMLCSPYLWRLHLTSYFQFWNGSRDCNRGPKFYYFRKGFVSKFICIFLIKLIEVTWGGFTPRWNFFSIAMSCQLLYIEKYYHGLLF